MDREIAKLKRRQKDLQQQINAEADPNKREELARQLAQAERELRQKDNDAYRRQHAQFS